VPYYCYLHCFLIMDQTFKWAHRHIFKCSVFSSF